MEPAKQTVATGQVAGTLWDAPLVMCVNYKPKGLGQSGTRSDQQARPERVRAPHGLTTARSPSLVAKYLAVHLPLLEPPSAS